MSNEPGRGVTGVTGVVGWVGTKKTDHQSSNVTIWHYQF